MHDRSDPGKIDGRRTRAPHLRVVVMGQVQPVVLVVHYHFLAEQGRVPRVAQYL